MCESFCGNYNVGYVKGLIQIEKKMKETGDKGYYTDPDEITYMKKEYPFYNKLVKFLNAQEEKLFEEDKRWSYEFHNKGIKGKPAGIWVYNKSDKSEPILYLRSDQFGFSVPRLDKKDKKLVACDSRYPYWKYLSIAPLDEKASFVKDCVNKTRTIGGSFLWTINKKGGKWSSQYNMKRGVGSYIEDSVDLTLYEVKHYYDRKEKKSLDDYEYKDDILYQCELLKSDSTMAIWLDHFESFKKYVEFFMLKPFIENGGPIDITSGKVLDEERVEEYRKNFKSGKLEEGGKGRIKELSPDGIRDMLNRVVAMTAERSLNM